MRFILLVLFPSSSVEDWMAQWHCIDLGFASSSTDLTRQIADPHLASRFPSSQSIFLDNLCNLSRKEAQEIDMRMKSDALPRHGKIKREKRMSEHESRHLFSIIISFIATLFFRRLKLLIKKRKKNKNNSCFVVVFLHIITIIKRTKQLGLRCGQC